MEDVSDVAFRRACRSVGAELCVTEFVHVDQIIHDSRIARRKLLLASDDRPTAIQIYGADPERLLAAALIAERAAPAFLDLNCGCWIPRIANKGAGAGWLRDPTAMIEMAAAIVRAVALPVTVKTRIGWGPESDMPIVDLARRLEDAGVAAITIHCRTALAGHSGPADWTWAARAREVVEIPVVVNGDVRTADDVVRALDETGCAAAMIGRGAIDHPWVFREARAALRGERIAAPTDEERRAMFAMITAENVAQRGERIGIGVSRRHARVLGDQAATLRPRLFAARSLDEVRDVLGA
jgi:tRNA-dihydrouridine synthase B